MKIKICRHKQRRYNAKMQRVAALSAWIAKGRLRA